MPQDVKMPKLDASSLTATFILHQTPTDDVYKLTHYKLNHPSYSHLDWNSAEEWQVRLQPQIFDSYFLICREACRLFVRATPILVNLACYGREMLLSNLSDDELQVFRDAKLLEKIPDEGAISWWDHFKVDARANLNDQLISQGRIAERWTIDVEINKLAALGIDEMPEWVSMDSDRHGFDISSYTVKEGRILPLLIEVKSFAQNSWPHIYVTANEWKKALETVNGDYVFHVWSIESQNYRILTIRDLEQHIPTNHGKGKWQSVLITLDW